MKESKRPGIYLARTNATYKWFNLIVVVEGTAPFMRISAIDLSDETPEFEHRIDDSEIVWGPYVSQDVKKEDIKI